MSNTPTLSWTGLLLKYKTENPTKQLTINGGTSDHTRSLLGKDAQTYHVQNQIDIYR